MAEHGLRSSAATAKGNVVNNERSMTVTVREGLPAIRPIVDAFGSVGVSRGTGGGLPLKDGVTGCASTAQITSGGRTHPRRLLVELGSFYEKVVKVKADVSGSGCNPAGRLGDGKRGGAQASVLAPILDSTQNWSSIPPGTACGRVHFSAVCGPNQVPG
jgi:hypothetical protein